MTSATTFITIQFGIPETIVTNNGAQFSAAEFKQFYVKNGIHHVPISPYHPFSNGLAEHAVRIFKQEFQKLTAGCIPDRISCFLFQYQITPHTTTSMSPAELLTGFVEPNLEQRVNIKQWQQKLH